MTPKVRRSLEANVFRSYVFSFLNAFQLWMPIWIVYLTEQRGLTLTEVTILETPFFLGMVLTEVPTGALADRYGRRVSLILSSVFLSAAVIAFGLATSFLLVLASYLVWSIAATLKSGADTALLYDTLKALGREAEFPRIQGRQLALNWAAALAGGLLGAPLADATSLAFPVVLSGLIVALSTAVALGLQEPPVERQEQRSYWRTVSSGLGFTWSRASVRWAVGFMAVAPVAFYASTFFVQPFLTGHGAAVASLGLFMVPLRLMNIAGNLSAHSLREKAGFWPLIWAAPAIAAAGAFTAAGWDSLYAFAVFPLMQAISSVRQVLVLDYLNSRIPSEMRATVLSSANLMTSLTLAVIAPVFGAIADAQGLRATYFTCGIASLAFLPLVIVAWRRADIRESAAAATASPRP